MIVALVLEVTYVVGVTAWGNDSCPALRGCLCCRSDGVG